MTTARTPRKAFKVQTLNTATGNPGGITRIMATSLTAAREKFTRDNPSATIHSIAKWTSQNR